jgi:hypothetical protein
VMSDAWTAPYARVVYTVLTSHGEFGDWLHNQLIFVVGRHRAYCSNIDYDDW